MALQVEVPDCDMRCLRHRTHGLQNDNSMLRMQCGLGSYSCCDNLLGILLRHPSRAAATRGKNVETSEYIHAPSCESAFHEQSTHYQRAAATSGCDIDILHGLRQRVAARGYVPHLWWTSGEA